MLNEPKRPWRWQEGGYTVTRTTPWSGPGCHNQCGILVYSKGNKVLKVEGDPEIPFSEGRLCVRCLSLPSVVHHPDRLTHPLKRTGKRGEGKWERISWEEAYDIIEDNVRRIQKEFGPEAIAALTGTGRNISHYMGKLCFSGFKSPNTTAAFLSGLACFVPKIMSGMPTVGEFVVADCSQMFPDRYDNPNWEVPKCMIIWGNNPVVSNPDSFMGHWIVECMKRGTKLIVIDPRLTWLASRAEIWLQIRPGTDAAVALGLINIIINENLYDTEFVEKWTQGFDELKERAAQYPPEKVAEISWVAKDKLLQAARMYATSTPASTQVGVAVEQGKVGMSTLLAIQNLWALTGNVDVPGGNIIDRPNEDFRVPPLEWGAEDVPQESIKKRIGYKKFPYIGPFFSQPDEILETMLTDKPYPMKMVWLQGTNPLACMGSDPKKIYTAMRRLDFVTVVDLFMTPTAMALADLVLPAASALERDSIRCDCLGVWWGPIRAVNKIVQVGACKSDEEIVLEVGKRLNPEGFPWDNVEQMLDWLLTDTGMTFQELREGTKKPLYSPFSYRRYETGKLRPDGKPGFNTSSGKFMLFNPVFKEIGLDHLPYYEEPPESPVSTPDLAEEYPYVLATGARSPGFFHSEHRQIPQLRELHPDPEVEIHQVTAKRLGIITGEWVWIENRLGKCKQKAKVVNTIDPRVVSAKHGWWFPEKSGPEPSLFGVWESNINQLMPGGQYGPSGLCAPYKSLMCKIYKVKEN